MPKATLKEIANALGLSPATVSKALKDYPDISTETKIKVRELAEAMNYKPNSIAQSLRNRESRIIGLVIPQIVHHFFANIIKGVIDEAEKKGYMVITLQSSESYENEKKQIQLLLEKNVDGVLISLSDHTVNYDHISDVIKMGTPVVLYDKISRLIDCSKVIIDDRKAAYNATTYLIQSGCRHIAHVRGSLKPQTTIDRFIGYKKALTDHGIEVNEDLVFEVGGLQFEDGYEAGTSIANSPHPIDAVFAMTDLLATGVMVRLQEAGKVVPDDVSIMGFSNWFLTRITSPPLSTINQPGYEMGSAAFNLLYDDIQANRSGTSAERKIIEIPTEIVTRGSTRPL